MKKFEGFSEGKFRLIQIPEPFFWDLLPLIDNLSELKFVLYVIWRLDHLEGSIRYLKYTDFVQDESLLQELGETPDESKKNLKNTLEKVVERGTLLEVKIDTSSGTERLFFLNAPKGRAAVQAIETGQWKPDFAIHDQNGTFEEPVNIYKLYEENIGTLTPMIAEALGEAEDTYPIEWIRDAIRIAVERNKRSWRYAEAILERWQQEGRDVEKEKPKNRRDATKDRRRYVEGELKDFIEH
jgi:DnaD/phage-associated family protein